MREHGDVKTVDELHLRNPIAQHNRDIDTLLKNTRTTGVSNLSKN